MPLRATQNPNCRPTPPVYLGATVTVRPGAQASPNPLALKIPDAYPMYIHEIQMGYRIATSASSASVVSSDNLAVQFSLGSYKITNNFVPLGLFQDLWAGDLYGGANAQQAQFAHWKLGRPLFIPSGAVLLPTFRNIGQTTGNATAFVRYIASIGDRPEPIVYLPYVTSWTSKAFTHDAADTDESAEDNLVNDGDTDLVLEKLSGAIDYFIGSDGEYIDNDTNYGDNSGGITQLMRLRIRDSDDRAIVDQLAVWDAIFPLQTRAFRVDGIKLAPRKYLKVYADKLAAGLSNTSDKMQLNVGMFGHRAIRGR